MNQAVTRAALSLACCLAAALARPATLRCPTLFEDGSPAGVGRPATAVGSLASSPQDHVPAAGLRFFVADDGLGAPRLLRLAKAAPGVVRFAWDPAAPFELSSIGPETCPFDAAWCAANWPDSGEVIRFTSREERGGCAWKRTFHAYIPDAAGAGPVPLVVVLHGGFGNGLDQLAQSWDELADGRLLAWRPNTTSCRYTYPSGYADVTSGAPCTPAAVAVRGVRPFVVVHPDGLEDEGAAETPDAPRHWEDGRVPSPGQSGPGPVRDDVAFIDHVLRAVQDYRPGLVDPRHLHVVGSSNGGMMAQRVACAVLAGSHAELSRVASVAVLVAGLPAPLADGSDGRERCPPGGSRELPLHLQAGRGFDTPDCAVYPCAAPVVDGDGRMPHGDPGGRHHVYSPELGLVLSGPDTLAAWVDQAAAASGASPAASSDAVGFYSTLEATTFGASPVRIERVITDGGAHETASTRLDTHPWARAWAFLASFQRLDDGTIAADPTPAVTGRY